ncbi:MAG: T9SS type A sorting domain-containing protein [Bacteroidota bacterium]
MKTRTISTTGRLLFILLITVWLQSNLLAQNIVTKTRGVWLWGSTLSQQGSSTVVNKLKDNYVNKVYLLVKGTAGTKISESLLNQFITDAHAKGIEVHLWYIISEDGAYISANPDAVVYFSPKPGTNNNPYRRTGTVVNLLYPGYKDYVMNNIGYYLKNFNCDGIHLDETRYYHLRHSFDQHHLKKANSLGIDTARVLNLFRNDYDNIATTGFIDLYASGDSDVVKWVNMRKDVIYDYTKSVKDSIQKIKPGIKLSSAFMAEASYHPNTADVHYSQNYSLHSPLLDEIIPMAYYSLYGKTTLWVKEVTAGAVSRVSSNCKISTGYQTFDPTTSKEVKEQIQYALEGGTFGLVNFRYGSTSDAEWAVIKEEYKKIYDVEVSVEEENGLGEIPAGFSLEQNYPNPFNPSTTISYQLANGGYVQLKVYDVLGREVATLVDEYKQPGRYSSTFYTLRSTLSSGVYFYRLTTPTSTLTKKMILMK